MQPSIHALLAIQGTLFFTAGEGRLIRTKLAAIADRRWPIDDRLIDVYHPDVAEIVAPGEVNVLAVG